jgi:hypothetical protein
MIHQGSSKVSIGGNKIGNRTRIGHINHHRHQGEEGCRHRVLGISSAVGITKLLSVARPNRDREMPYFGQDLFIKAEAKGPLTSKKYLAPLASLRFVSYNRATRH